MNFQLHRCGFLAVILLSLALTACDSSRREALKELDQLGIRPNGLSLLHAVQNDQAHHVDLLLRAGTFSGQRDPDGRTALHHAILHRQVDIVYLLINSGADLNARDPQNVTPLGNAVVAGESALADLLMDKGAQPDSMTPDGDRILPWAIRNGRLAFVRRLMEHGADPHQKDGRGTPLLHVAIEADRKDLAAELIELGADSGATNAEGESTLVLALRRGWREQVTPLILNGADPNLSDREGLTPFRRALENGDHPLARQLRQLGAVPDSTLLADHLRRAFESRDRAEAGRLLSLGADPSPPAGSCLLTAAVSNDRTDFLHLFLGYHPAPSDLLYEACRRKNFHHVSLLLAHGADPNPRRAPFLDSPLSLAMEHGGDRQARILLSAGAFPSGLADGTRNALHRAVALGRSRTVRWLLEQGADPNQVLPHPVDPDFVAQFKSESFRWILRNNRKITPLMIAAHTGSVETAQALLDHGARTNVWTRGNSLWPINFASRRNDIPMMRLILGKDPHQEERLIVLSLGEQFLRVFDNRGTEIFGTRVSTGRSGYRTRTGEFAITNKYRNWTSTIYNSSMPYFQRLSCSDFGFHRGYVPNYPASHGCIRVPTGNAAKLFSLTKLGDRVKITD